MGCLAASQPTCLGSRSRRPNWPSRVPPDPALRACVSGLVAAQRADPLEALGVIPVRPLPCWGWGNIPDQYGRRWDGDDGSSPMPKAPSGLADLPPILPGWGSRRAPAGRVTC